MLLRRLAFVSVLTLLAGAPASQPTVLTDDDVAEFARVRDTFTRRYDRFRDTTIVESHTINVSSDPRTRDSLSYCIVFSYPGKSLPIERQTIDLDVTRTGTTPFWKEVGGASVEMVDEGKHRVIFPTKMISSSFTAERYLEFLSLKIDKNIISSISSLKNPSIRIAPYEFSDTSAKKLSTLIQATWLMSATPKSEADVKVLIPWEKSHVKAEVDAELEKAVAAADDAAKQAPVLARSSPEIAQLQRDNDEADRLRKAASGEARLIAGRRFAETNKKLKVAVDQWIDSYCSDPRTKVGKARAEQELAHAAYSSSPETTATTYQALLFPTVILEQ